jgi:hypothetical protein
MALPVRIKFDELPQHALPRSSTARFTERWQSSVGDDGFLEHIVERWRMSGIPSSDNAYSLSMMADALSLGNGSGKSETVPPDTRPRDSAALPPNTTYPAASQPASRPPPTPQFRREASPSSALPAASGEPRGETNAPIPGERSTRNPASASPSRDDSPGRSMATTVSLRSLRDRLTRPNG